MRMFRLCVWLSEIVRLWSESDPVEDDGGDQIQETNFVTKVSNIFKYEYLCWRKFMFSTLNLIYIAEYSRIYGSIPKRQGRVVAAGCSSLWSAKLLKDIIWCSLLRSSDQINSD